MPVLVQSQHCSLIPAKYWQNLWQLYTCSLPEWCSPDEYFIKVLFCLCWKVLTLCIVICKVMERQEVATIVIIPQGSCSSPSPSASSMTPSPEGTKHSPKTSNAATKKTVSYSIDSILGVRVLEPTSHETTSESALVSGTAQCFIFSC